MTRRPLAVSLRRRPVVHACTRAETAAAALPPSPSCHVPRKWHGLPMHAPRCLPAARDGHSQPPPSTAPRSRNPPASEQEVASSRLTAAPAPLSASAARTAAESGVGRGRGGKLTRAAELQISPASVTPPVARCMQGASLESRNRLRRPSRRSGGAQTPPASSRPSVRTADAKGGTMRHGCACRRLWRVSGV